MNNSLVEFIKYSTKTVLLLSRKLNIRPSDGMIAIFSAQLDMIACNGVLQKRWTQTICT